MQVFWLISQIWALQDAIKNYSNGHEGVTVIVAAKNEAKNLDNLIKAILNQKTTRPFELIIVNDRSEDASESILKNWLEKSDLLKTINQKSVKAGLSPKKEGLRKAITLAGYPLILQTDADCMPCSAHWIEQMAKSCGQNYDFVIGLSTYRRENGFLNQCIQWDTAWTAASMIAFAAIRKPYMALGRNMLFRKTAFDAVGGYGMDISILSGDDDLLLQKINNGKNVNYCITKDSRTVSIPKNNWVDWWHQKARHMSVGKFYKPKVVLLLGMNYLTILFYFLLVVGIVLNVDLATLLWLFLLRIGMLTSLFYIVGKRTGSILNPFFLPIIEIVHALFILFAGIRAQIWPTKKWI